MPLVTPQLAFILLLPSGSSYHLDAANRAAFLWLSHGDLDPFGSQV